MKRERRNKFTMVELLLVMVILGTLAAVVLPKFTGRSEQAKESAAKTAIAALETALEAYEIDNGSYPSEDEGLDMLVDEPEDMDTWHGPYMKKRVTKDPWGNPYVYVQPGENNTKGFDLSSNGPDKEEGTEDDIVNWEVEEE